jgi:hypothetical protein
MSSGADPTGAATALMRERLIDDALEMTFPASDPPAWMSSGAPRWIADRAGEAERRT